MKKCILLALMMLVGVLSSYAVVDKYTIDRSELPEEAQTMLATYFPKTKIGMIKVDKHLLKKTDYDVKLVNGTKIEFNNSGKWTFVDCGNRALPEKIVPNSIKKYISKNFEKVKTVSIKRTSGHYEIGLSDGVLLKFNLLGQFKGVIDISH